MFNIASLAYVNMSVFFTLYFVHFRLIGSSGIRGQKMEEYPSIKIEKLQ
jgi:hypothetical protein